MKVFTLFIVLLLTCNVCQGQYSRVDSTLSRAGVKLIQAKKNYVIGRVFIITSGGLLAIAGIIEVTGNNNYLNDNLKYNLTVWGILTHAAGWFFNGRAWKRIEESGRIMIGQQNYGVGIGFVF